MKRRQVVYLALVCAAAALAAVFGARPGASAGGARRAAADAPRAGAATQSFVLTDFGATGDGVTDDGPALQAALDALAEAGGGALHVPAGRYAIVTPVAKTFTDPTISITISGVASDVPAPPHTAGGEELTRGLGLTSEFLPRTGEATAAVYVEGLRSLVIEELAFVGTPDVWDDAAFTLYLSDVGQATIRHSEFYGLASMQGAVVIARRSALAVERSVFLGCATSSGVYASVIQNTEWKSVSVADTAFTDYGQRPELYGKLGMAAPWSWVNLGDPAPPTADSPRREAVFRNVFFDEGGLTGISSMPRVPTASRPIDLLHVSGLRMNVSNLHTSGLYLEGLRGALVEDAFFGWSAMTETAVNLLGAGSAVVSRLDCDVAVTTVRADSATDRLAAIDVRCPVVASLAPSTRVFNAATPDDDPTLYVRSRFQTALGRAPDPAAHFYWADRILRCDADAACAASARAALAAYLASDPQPAFALEGRATDEEGRALAGVAVTLSGSQTAATVTGADGRYRFQGLPTSGVYTVSAAKAHHTFAAASQTVTTPAGARVVDFPAALDRHTLSGLVVDSAGRGVQGVTVTLSGGRAATATTDAGGAFVFASLPAGADYTLTPSSARYSFEPASQSFTALGEDRAAVFPATPLFHSITAQIFTVNNAPVPGARVTLTGAKSAEGLTDSKGFVSFGDLPRGGSYTVAPAPLVGYTFPSGPQTFDNLTAEQGYSFFAAPTAYKIRGRVTAGGSALAGVTMTLSGSASAATTTDADGAYSFDVPASGDFTVTPSRRHYTFAPASAALGGVTGDRTTDFAATLNRHKITGRVARADGRAMAGVTVTLSGAQAATATTDANGDYAFAGLPAGGAYTVAPSRAGYDFAPASRSFADLGADQSAPFVVSPATYAVAGRVTAGGSPLAGVAMTLSGSRSATATTDTNGAYSFSVSSEGSYTVTPSKANYTFAPAGATFNDPVGAKTADFAATLNRHRIAGRVTKAGGQALAGVTVTLSGAATATATTDAAGVYSFADLAAGGDYTVTPARAGYDFAPKSKALNALGADQTADFTAAALDYTLTGRVTAGGSALAGVTMTLSGSRAATTTTDANGAYSFSVSSEGSYTVTPSRRNYTFAPPSVSFANPVADRTADFAATLNRHAVAGRVTNPNNYGLAGVIVTLSGAQAATATTDANGDYAFAGLPAGGSYTVTPSLPTLTFAPASRAFDDLGADARADFVGSLATYRLSGRVTENGAGLSGVSVGLAGLHPSLGRVDGHFVTAADGAYAFDVPAAGDYTVTPSKKNYVLAPAAAAFKGLAAGATADFSASPLPTFEFAAASYEVNEDGGGVVVTVTRGGDTAPEATVVYQAVGDTARRGSDFLASIGQLTFAPGETSKTFEVFITDDAFVEGFERFTLTLAPGEGSGAGSAASALVTIDDNDAAPAAANPVDADEFFVRQHYRDFFSREPDAEGLAFWRGELAKCGADAACREARRVSVSAAFFLSIEFQETGYLVYRLYRAAFERAPDRVEEFMLDARVMGEGVVVGRDGWEKRLGENRAAFVRAFVERPRFAARYPASLTPEQFVDALFDNAGVAPSAAERRAAVDDFGGAPTSADAESRSLALRRVAEHEALKRQESNRAFVLMQYFGYLRRDPDEAPDANLDGYNFWLSKLDQFGGDYERAEMVKAFLSSVEYRGRFGN